MSKLGVILLATLLIQTLVSAASVALAVLAPVIAGELGQGPGFAGWATGLVYFGAILASLTAGMLVGRVGALRASQFSLLFAGIGLLLAATAVPGLMILAALCIGVGYGPVTPSSSHLLARSTPPERVAFVFSLKQTGVPLGGALAGAVLPGLAGLFGWRGALAGAGIACMVTALVAQPLRPELDHDRDPTRRVAWASLLAPLRLLRSDRGLIEMAGISAAYSSVQMSLVAYLVTYLHGELNLSLVSAGLMLAVAQGTSVFGRVLFGALADRLRAPRAVLAGLGLVSGLAGATLALAGHALSTSWLLALLAVYGAAAIGWNGVFLAEVARLAPSGKAAVATSGVLFFTYLGVVLGPPTFGAIAQMGGSFSYSFAAAATVATLCALPLPRGPRIRWR